MKFPVAASLLDACVLGVISVKSTYGYDLTQKIQATIDVSESTLYPVLRRLLKDSMLTTHDEAYDGRNRRYYEITELGKEALANYKTDWETYKESIDKLIKGGISGE